MKRPGKIMPLTVKLLVSKPATSPYPVGGGKDLPAIRGRIVYEAEKCIGCNACMRDCPTGAIVIDKLPEKHFACTIHNDRCIYCSQCVDSCPRDALHCTPEFELAALTKENMAIRTAPEGY